MKIVNLYEAKTHLSSVVEAALKGEDVVLARSGTPLVRLVPVGKRKPSDAFGIDHGVFVVPPDFDETPPDFEDYGSKD